MITKYLYYVKITFIYTNKDNQKSEAVLDLGGLTIGAKPSERDLFKNYIGSNYFKELLNKNLKNYYIITNLKIIFFKSKISNSGLIIACKRSFLIISYIF